MERGSRPLFQLLILSLTAHFIEEMCSDILIPCADSADCLVLFGLGKSLTLGFVFTIQWTD